MVVLDFFPDGPYLPEASLLRWPVTFCIGYNIFPPIEQLFSGHYSNGTLDFGSHNGKSVYFFVVWSFLLFGLFGCYFVCCLGGGVFVFAVWAGAQAPPKQQKKTRPRPNSKKKTRARPNSKKKHATAPSELVFFCCLGGWVCLFLLLFGRGACFFLLFGWRACSFFCCLGGGVFFFLLFGPGECFFCCLGGGREFTHLPVCLARL